jgi:hypothetical protein
MPTSYTSLLGLALPATGELAGTWGTTVNNSITELVEDAIAATATASVASGDWTLSTTGSGAANEARCAILIPTGSPGVSRNIIAPSQSKAYIVINQSNAAVVLKGAATTGVSIGAGDKALIAWNGSDFVRVGASAGGADTQVQYNSSGNLAGSANLTFDGTTLTAAAIADSSLTSGRVTYAGASGNLTDSTNLTFDGSNLQIGAQGDLRLADSDSSNYVALQAPGTVASNVTFTLPNADGTSGQVLQTNGSGTLSFTTVSSPAKASGALITNTTTVSESYTVPSGTNAFSVGPITVSSGYAITVSSGQRWVVI